MKRRFLQTFVLTFFLGVVCGCGGSEPTKKEEDPFKARQQAQKEKAQDKFMKPPGAK